jgi:hypothetical protein
MTFVAITFLRDLNLVCYNVISHSIEAWVSSFATFPLSPDQINRKFVDYY